MEQLNKNQSATDFIGDVNSNLREMGAEADVSVSMSADSLVNALNTAFASVDGRVVLSKDTDAETFVGHLNTNFEAAAQEGGGGDEPPSPSSDEMTDTLNKVVALKDNIDLLIPLSTDLHHEKVTYVTKTVDGVDYSVPISDGTNTGKDKYYVTFGKLINDQKEFIGLVEYHGITVNAVACLGDIIDGHRKDRVLREGQAVDGYYAEGDTLIMSAYDRVSAFVAPMMQEFLGMNKPFLFAVGNHDDNTDSNVGVQLTLAQLESIYIKDIVSCDGSYSASSNLDYYKDFAEQKIRVIVLFCGTGNSWYFTEESVDYLKSAVNSMPSGYKAIILCHIRYANDQINGINEPTWREGFYEFVDGNDKILFMIAGHSHTDGVCGWPLPTIWTACNKIADAHPNDYKDLWDAVCVEKVHNVVDCIRYNGGIVTITYSGVSYTFDSSLDRTIHYNCISKIIGQETVLTALPRIGETVSSWYISEDSSFKNRSALKADTFITVGSNGTTYEADVENGLTALEVFNAASVTDSQISIFVKAQSNVCNQYVTVYVTYAKNGANVRREYWFVKIPKASAS